MPVHLWLCASCDGNTCKFRLLGTTPFEYKDLQDIIATNKPKAGMHYYSSISYMVEHEEPQLKIQALRADKVKKVLGQKLWLNEMYQDRNDSQEGNAKIEHEGKKDVAGLFDFVRTELNEELYGEKPQAANNKTLLRGSKSPQQVAQANNA